MKSILAHLYNSQPELAVLQDFLKEQGALQDDGNTDNGGTDMGNSKPNTNNGGKNELILDGVLGCENEEQTYQGKLKDVGNTNKQSICNFGKNLITYQKYLTDEPPAAQDSIVKKSEINLASPSNFKPSQNVFNQNLKKTHPKALNLKRVKNPPVKTPRNEYHIKFDIFDQTNENYVDKGLLGIIPQMTIPKHLQRIGQPKYRFSRKMILFLDTFHLDCQKQSCLNEKPFENDSEIIYKDTQFIVSQNPQFKVYISTLRPKREYKIVRKIILQARITAMLFISNQNLSYSHNKQNIQNNREPVSSFNQQYGTLYLGCSNHCIYAVPIDTNFLTSSKKMQLSCSRIIQVLNDEESQKELNRRQKENNGNIGENREITHIIGKYDNRNILYVVLNSEIKIFHRQFTKSEVTLVCSTDNSNQKPKKKYKYEPKYVQFEPSNLITLNCCLKVLKYIKLPKSLTGDKNKICMILWTDTMHGPCILDQQEMELWFPYKIEQLVQAFNSVWDQFYCYEPLPMHQVISNSKGNIKSSSTNKIPLKVEIQLNKSQIVTNILHIQYESLFNNMIIGCSDGNTHFGNIKYLKKRQEIKNSQDNYRKEFLTQIKGNQQSFENNKQVDKDSEIFQSMFNYIFSSQYTIQEGSTVTSLSILRNQPFVCFSTNSKVIFYNVVNRQKFSENIKQKQYAMINCVRWAVNDQLIFSAIKSEQGRFYIYTKELPILTEEQLEMRNKNLL